MTEPRSAELAPPLRLFSDGLLSKWGFNDGDEPDWLLDYCDDHGLDYPDAWHAALRTLVHEHLLPALDQRVEVYDIETIHNPIRAAYVDGVKVSDDVVYGRQDGPNLSPEWVEVPLDKVLAACGIEYPTTPASIEGADRA